VGILKKEGIMYIDRFLEIKKLKNKTMEDEIERIDSLLDTCEIFESNDVIESKSKILKFLRFLKNNNISSKYFRIDFNKIYFSKTDITTDCVIYDYSQIYSAYLYNLKSEYIEFIII